MEDKKLELEEISLEDRKKIYFILYPSCQLYTRSIEELEELLKRAYIPTHKIKVNA